MRALLLLAGLLLLSAHEWAAAQRTTTLFAKTSSTESVTPYTIERDSMQQRVARVQARSEARIASFHAGFAAVGGTRRKVVSFGRLKPLGSAGQNTRYTQVKVQISKHKTRGAEVERIYYYGLGKRLLLAEYYEQHQLVRLDLHEYPLREGGEYGTVFRKTQWVSGDYLHLTTYAQENRDAPQQYYYTSPQVPR